MNKPETNFPQVVSAALAYAVDRNWTSFPVPPGTKKSHLKAKHCNGVRWGASKHPAVIRRNYRRWPDANIGIPTGPENGLFVVEADTSEGHDVDGIASLKALETEHGALPETLQAISPSGSLHHYFIHPGFKIKTSASEIAPGVDVRGDGGMVLVPPSIRLGVGSYRWLNDLPIADAPTWLLDLIVKTNGRKSRLQAATVIEPVHSISERASATIRNPINTSKYVEAALHRECEAVASATKGHRNEQLNRSAFNLGTLVGAGELMRSNVVDVLLNAATANGLMRDDGKVACKATIASGLNAGAKQPRTVPEPKAFRQHDMDWLREMMLRRPG